MALTTFYFSRYHFNEEIESEKKLQYLLDGISNKASVISHGFKYKFSTVEKVEHDGNNFLVGTLIKYNPSASDEIINEETGEIEETISSNKVIAKAKFVIHPSTSQITYTTVTGHISKSTFSEIFRKIFGKNHEVEPKQKIISIFETNVDYSFVNRVQSIKKVKKITITVVPSNPQYSDDWQSIDEDLKKRRIDVLKEIQISKAKEGLIVDKETEAKLKMTEDGYGNAVVDGENEMGNAVTISTRQQDRQENVPLDIQETIASQNLVRKLWDKIKTISSRAKDSHV